MRIQKPLTVYRFLRKVGGSWSYIMDKNQIPLAITTTKPQSAILHIFKHKYPSIASMYHLGETLVAEPDMVATKKLAEFKANQKKEYDQKVQKMWWNND